MNKKLLIAVSSAILVFLLSSCGWCETTECYKAKQEYEASQAEIRRQNVETERKFEIERERIRAEAEAKKPESVRLQEAKNEETSFGEGLSDAVTVGVAAYAGVKVLDILTR